MVLRAAYMFILLEGLYLASVVGDNVVKLYPENVVAVENDTKTLYCIGNQNISEWRSSSFKEDCRSSLGYSSYTGKCTETACLISTKYDCDCLGIGNFSVTLKKISRNQHGEKWWCLQNDTQSNTIRISVAVPVKNVYITSHLEDNISLCENSDANVQCETSEARPAANITWTLQSRSSPRESFELIASTSVKNTSGFFVSSSILNFRPNKTLNGWKLNCSSTNVHGQKQDSAAKLLNIKYPPNQPPMIQNPHIENKGNYKVIENHTASLTCVVTNGNPSASLTWTCINNSSTKEKEANVVEWKASRYDVKSCICVAEHECNSWKTSVAVNVSVLYPPEITNLKNRMVIEGSQVNISCPFKHGNPQDTTVKWSQPTMKKDNPFLYMANISRLDSGLYTCTVNNTMEPTNATLIFGSNSRTINITVLYPPNIYSLTNRSVTEGSNLSIECDFEPGNPRNTTVFWTRNIDDQLWNNSQLIIKNVTRTDHSLYTCTVFNEMIFTSDTFNPVRKTENSSFQLNVLFPASIKDFYVDGKDSETTVVVNETDIVSIICDVAANPASNITIRIPQGDRSVMSVQTNAINHTIYNATYVHAGVYTCFGSNNYTNETSSSSKLSLIVRSYPRPTADKTNNEIVTSTLHAEVTMEFAAHDYLEIPNRTIFSWYKGNSSIEANGIKFNTSSCGLKSRLTIFDITQTDFAKYRVKVENSVGEYQHFYILKAKDVPDEPVNFMYDEDSISDSSVTLKWEPAFNGGYTQTFILNYKKITEYRWQNRSVLDSGNALMIFTLSGLSNMTTYEVQMYARNEVGDSVAADMLRFTTKAAPIGTPIESHSAVNIGIVAGSVSSTIIIVTIAGVIVAIWIYRQRNNKETGRVYQNVPFSGNNITTQRKRESLQIEETLFEGLQEVDDVPVITKERTEYCNSPDIIEKIDRIKVTELFSYVSGRSEESFEADYQKLPTELQKPCTFARKPENIALNRYNGIYPYDHSRVKLHGHPDFFINACYIDGYKSSKAYIASLGPTAKTTSDFKTFWKMIWYERADIIIMLTNLREPSGMKCEKYWPEGGASIWYGDVCVSSEATECFAEYTIRQFSVSKEEERRSLTHLHYTAWPDKTVPEDVTSLIEFRQRMKTTPTSSEGPIVVHCSAGIGRTGTLIALDRLIEEGQDKGSLNVFACVENMREQRVKMVQTFEQYMYIYKALVNALTFDCETIPVETFNEYVDATNNNLYSMMFQQLRQSVETDSNTDVEVRSKNEKLTNKNRRGADIPGNRFRAMLYLNRADEGSEYINAVYINSFVKKDYFIAAQSPLPCTVADFITMVYQEDCSCIATMEDLKDPGMTVGQYLPDDKKTLTVGNFKVSSSRLETKHNYVVREMKIKYSGKIDSGEKTVYHFQYTKWMTGHDTPVDARDFVQFVNEVKEYENELGEERSHVLVHCLKANERSGLFCALAILMEKIKLERQVNVLNTLRHLRTRRQTAITSMEQLKFCYQATSAYIKMNKLG